MKDYTEFYDLGREWEEQYGITEASPEDRITYPQLCIRGKDIPEGPKGEDEFYAKVLLKRRFFSKREEDDGSVKKEVTFDVKEIAFPKEDREDYEDDRTSSTALGVALLKVMDGKRGE